MDKPMLTALGAACAQARKTAGISQASLAHFLGRDQSTVVRFESGRVWPQDPDQTVRTYAHHAGIKPEQLWVDAATRLTERAPRRRAADAPPPPRRAARGSAASSRAKAKRQAAG